MKLKPSRLRDSVEKGVINCFVRDIPVPDLDREGLRQRVVKILSDPECSAEVLNYAYKQADYLEIRAARVRAAIEEALDD